jgi:hypothetical protein
VVQTSKELEDQLKKSRVEIVEVKTELATATERRQRIKDKLNVLHQALGTTVETVLREMPSFTSSYGLTALELAVDSLDVNQFFDWLRICLAMLDAGVVWRFQHRRRRTDAGGFGVQFAAHRI